MTDPPTVSVLLPVYNAERFLSEAVASILAQSYTDYELLAVDDGSTDRSWDILDQFARLDARIVLIHKENQGVAAALNAGLERARGRYLARMDADDCMHPQRLARQVRVLDDDPRLVIIGSAYQEIDSLGSPVRIHHPPHTHTAIRWRLLFQNAFAHPTVMLRTKVIRSAGLKYDPEELVEDYALWSEVIRFGRGCNLFEPLLNYRIHPGQASKIYAADFEKSATRIAQRNLMRLGIQITAEQMTVLRAWQSSFPQRLSTEEMQLALTVLDILDRFSRQPDLDPAELRILWGRWTLRLLMARTPSGANWKKQVLKRGRVFMIPAYVLNRLTRRY